MKKKYDFQELIALNNKRWQQPCADSLMKLHFFPSFSQITEKDLYSLYVEDFYTRFHHQNPCFLLMPFDRNVSYFEYLHQYFGDKKQDFLQLWISKIFSHLVSQKKKNLKTNTSKYQKYFHSPLQFVQDYPKFRHFLQSEFFSFFQKGKIVEKKKIGYWSFALQCSIPQDQIIFKRETVEQYEIKYFIEWKGISLTILESDVDLIFWDVALLVHPWDKRYKSYIWKNVLIPIVNRSIPILADDTVDITKGNGIQRVNPFSTQEWIELAQKHHLPLDHFVFDEKGIYTDLTWEMFAWKPRMQFKQNVFEFLNDIVNLGERSEIEKEIPYFKQTGEKLCPYLLDQFCLDLSDEKQQLERLYEQKNPQLLETIRPYLEEDFCLANFSLYGESLPVVQKNGQYVLAEFPFQLSDYQETVWYYVDYLLFQLCRILYPADVLLLDNFWEFLVHSSAQIEELLEFCPVEDPEKKNQISQFFIDLKQGKEWVIEELLDFIAHSKLLTIEDDKVSFSYFKEQKIIFKPLIFSDFALKCFSTLYLQKNYPRFQQDFLLPEQEYPYFAMLSLLNIFYFHTCDFSLESYLMPEIQDAKRNFKEIEHVLDLYGDDAVRLSLLVDHSLSAVKEYDQFLKMVRNGVRFYQQEFEFKGTFDEALQILDTASNDLDVRMVSELIDFLQNLSFCPTIQSVIDLFPKFRELVQQKFFAWYVEINKIEKTQTSSAGLFICLSLILSFLWLFVPTYTNALYENLWWKENWFHLFSLKKARSSQQVFIYEIFNNIFHFKQDLGFSKHQKIALYIKSDPSSLVLFQQYEEVFRKIFCFDELTLLKLHEEDLTWYEQRTYNFTTIWIKKIDCGPIGKKQLIEEMKQKLKMLEQKEEYYKTLYLSSWDSLFQDKIQEIKKEREILEMDIQKKKKNLE